MNLANPGTPNPSGAPYSRLDYPYLYPHPWRKPPGSCISQQQARILFETTFTVPHRCQTGTLPTRATNFFYRGKPRPISRFSSCNSNTHLFSRGKLVEIALLSAATTIFNLRTNENHAQPPQRHRYLSPRPVIPFSFSPPHPSELLLAFLTRHLENCAHANAHGPRVV